MTRDPREHIEVAMTADLVILTIRDGKLQVVLVVRGYEPFEGKRALPGGFLRLGESVEDAAARELGEETGLDPKPLPLEQVHVYSAPGRDPRFRVITCAFLAIAPNLPIPKPDEDSDARRADWVPVSEVINGNDVLAFDHDRILRDAIHQARIKLQYTTIATAFCEPEFTIGELREVYEAVWGIPLDRANFHRKVKNAKEFIVETGGTRSPKGKLGRPAALYRAGDGTELDSPILLDAVTRASID